MPAKRLTAQRCFCIWKSPLSAAPIRKTLMTRSAPAVRRFNAIFALALLVPALTASALAADAFPYEQQLMLDVAPMGKVRRVPSVTVASDGTAQLNLWCKTGAAQITVNDS